MHHEHEHISWKVVYVATTFSLLVLALAYYLISPKSDEYFTEEKIDKLAEFSETKVSGRKNGQKIWELYAAAGWTTVDQKVTFLKDVKDGEILLNNSLAVKELACPLAKAYQGSDMVEAFGYPDDKHEGTSQLTALINLGTLSDPKQPAKTEWTKMIADYLKHEPDRKLTEVKENITLTKKGLDIFAQRMMVYHENKLAVIEGDVRLTRSNGTLTADKLNYYSENEKLEAQNKVAVTITKNKKNTKLKCDQAIFFSDIAKPMELKGNVEVRQGKKAAVAERGTYRETEEELILSGKTRAIFEKAADIIGEDSATKLKNEEGKKLLQEKTTLTCDELVISTKNGNATARGRVDVTQKKNEAKSDLAAYEENKDLLTLTGNVLLKKQDIWVSAREVLVSIKDETFTAVGSVEAEFKL